MSSISNYISMPVVKIDAERGRDDQSGKNNQKKTESRLPRMRSQVKKESSDILAETMQTGRGQKPQPPVMAQPKPAAMPKDEPKIVAEPFADSSKKDITQHEQGLTLADLYDLEDRLQSRDDRPTSNQILSVIRSLTEQHDAAADRPIKSMDGLQEQSDMLCVLDFIEGYLETMKSDQEAAAEIAESMSLIRQRAQGHTTVMQSTRLKQAEKAADSDMVVATQYAVSQEVSANGQLIVELRDKLPSLRPLTQRTLDSERLKASPDDRASGDTLPLIVQRSV